MNKINKIIFIVTAIAIILIITYLLLINRHDNFNILIIESKKTDSENVYKEASNEEKLDNIKELDKMSNDKVMDEKVNYTENDVISYFENIENDVSISDINVIKLKGKEHFIKIVDFIFYGEEIRGYTFNELTDIAKLKIIGIGLKVDKKIEEKVPGYKESISNIGNRGYSNIKDRLVTLYLDISSKICEKNEDDCIKAKEIFVEIKSFCEIGWDFIKEIASSTTTKLKKWYEVYSEK